MAAASSFPPFLGCVRNSRERSLPPSLLPSALDLVERGLPSSLLLLLEKAGGQKEQREERGEANSPLFLAGEEEEEEEEGRRRRRRRRRGGGRRGEHASFPLFSPFPFRALPSSVFFPKNFSPSAESGFGKERERELPSSPLPLCTLRDPAPTREDPRRETTTTTDGFP